MMKYLLTAVASLFIVTTGVKAVDAYKITTVPYKTVQAASSVCPDPMKDMDWVRNMIKESKYAILAEKVMEGGEFLKMEAALRETIGPAPDGVDNFIAFAVAPEDGSAEARIYFSARKGSCSLGAIVIPLSVFNALWAKAQGTPA